MQWPGKATVWARLLALETRRMVSKYLKRRDNDLKGADVGLCQDVSERPDG